MGEKTEKATPKKLRDARKKGQVAKSQDLPSAFTFIASVWAVLGLSTLLYSQLSSFLIAAFKSVGSSDLDRIVPALFFEAIGQSFMISLPILGVVSAVGVIITFLTVGPVFAPEVFKFDIKKFDPIQNLKAKFKMKTLVELLKSVLKISIAGYLIYGVVYDSIPVLIKAVSLPMASALLLFNSFMMEVLIKVGLFFIVVAVADFAYQKYSFANDMKMEKFEVKQEYKNTEGDPHIKGKRKQMAQEIAFGDGPSGGVKQAQAVVTNPTHKAIAIGYRREIDAAPYILGMGEDLLALQMVRIAERHGIPVIRNIRLAHKLWEEGEVYEYVPEETYEAIAEILRWIESLNTENAYEYTPKEE